MSDPLKVYVAATRQDGGKTTVAIGLLETIGDPYPRAGYIKPVGQQTTLLGSHQVDKDATLMNEVFHIGGELPDMSPVAIPKGFTEEYILHGDTAHLGDRILDAFGRAGRDKDFIVIEGTGHAGVGSVFDLSNAAVARLLEAPVVLVTCAGIGRPIDEVMLNKALFDSFGVKVIGVVVNKVLPDKLEKVSEFVRLGFRRLGIEVFGVIPYSPLLASPTIRQLQEDIRGELLNGEDNLDRLVGRVVVGAMPVPSIFDRLKGDVLLVTPGNREDLILAAIACDVPGIAEDCHVQGIILTGGIRPNRTVLKLLRTTRIPIVLADDDTFATARKITELSVKLRSGDREKIAAVKKMIKEHLNVDALLGKAREAAGP
jgi:hypothetical protein